MFQKLVSHNEDLKQLVEKGYAVGFDSNCMIVRDVPYLDAAGNLHWGAIVTKLEFIDQERVKQTDHQIYFAGSVPHGLNGQPIPNLGGGSCQLPLTAAYNDVVVERSFSNKPKKDGQFRDFHDFFEKIESYVTIISGPAITRHGANPLTFRVDENVAADPVFKFHDTLTSRAEITDLAAKFKDDVVALIGLGGTGAYLLDFLVKTPVREIRAFDLDTLHVHNAFRSPGRLDATELGLPKSEVYQKRYENFRHGLSCIPKFLDASSSDDLKGVTFAFVCVDKGLSRAGIFELLITLKIPFINVGMGLNRKHGALNGMMRTTYYSAENAVALLDKRLSDLTNADENIYKANIQIGELNALNACLAVMKFKQLRGYYFEESSLYDLVLEIGDLKVVSSSSDEDKTPEG